MRRFVDAFVSCLALEYAILVLYLETTFFSVTHSTVATILFIAAAGTDPSTLNLHLLAIVAALAAAGIWIVADSLLRRFRDRHFASLPSWR